MQEGDAVSGIPLLHIKKPRLFVGEVVIFLFFICKYYFV